MSNCRFMFENHITGTEMMSVSSAQPGMVGTPAPETQGSAVCYAAGQHSGDQDQVFVVEIDSIAGGSDVGQASFRWKRASSSSWEASGVTTAVNLIDLADGVSVKWTSGTGQDFYAGDRWSILAMRRQGPAMLTPAGSPRVTAMRGLMTFPPGAWPSSPAASQPPPHPPRR